MSRNTDPLVNEAYMWLLNRLKEAVHRNPESTLADGLEYALECLDRELSEGRGGGGRLLGRNTS